SHRYSLCQVLRSGGFFSGLSLILPFSLPPFILALFFALWRKFPYKALCHIRVAVLRKLLFLEFLVFLHIGNKNLTSLCPFFFRKLQDSGNAFRRHSFFNQECFLFLPGRNLIAAF